MGLDRVRAPVRGWRTKRGFTTLELLAQWQLLMLGSIVEAGEGDAEAAHQARAVGELLLAQERLGSAGGAGAKTEGR